MATDSLDHSHQPGHSWFGRASPLGAVNGGKAALSASLVRTPTGSAPENLERCRGDARRAQVHNRPGRLEVQHRNWSAAHIGNTHTKRDPADDFAGVLRTLRRTAH